MAFLIALNRFADPFLPWIHGDHSDISEWHILLYFKDAQNPSTVGINGFLGDFLWQSWVDHISSPVILGAEVPGLGNKAFALCCSGNWTPAAGTGVLLAGKQGAEGQQSVVVCVTEPVMCKGMNLSFNDFMLPCLMKMPIDSVPSVPDTGNHAGCSEERQKNQWGRNATSCCNRKEFFLHTSSRGSGARELRRFTRE